MKRNFFVFLVIFFILPHLGWGAKYSGEFLYLGVGGKALGMGGAFVSVADDPSAGYYNPAGLSQLQKKELLFMHSETFGSLLNHDFLALVLPLKNKSYISALGFGFIGLSGDGIKITELQNPGEPIGPGNRPQLVEEKSHGDYVFIFSYSLGKSKTLSVGASFKAIYRNLAVNSAYGAGLDLGALVYLPHQINLGANLMDFTTTFLSYDNGTKESIYPTLKLGLSTRRELKDFSLTLGTDGDIRKEKRKYAGQYWIGSFSLDTHLGVSLSYLKKLTLRGGFDQGNLTLGAGFVVKRFFVDVAFLDHDELENTYRASLKLRF
ncbi:MAG: hypothetical protein AMJ90_03825 [candidate division Zixibacteria bacterium SM23_73_2]|nr:MAG: hypothetical protein AMJ90_03825 [candidate division Zixibacteria bacterium SM23_73_2]